MSEVSIATSAQDILKIPLLFKIIYAPKVKGIVVPTRLDKNEIGVYIYT